MEEEKNEKEQEEERRMYAPISGSPAYHGVRH